MKRKSALCFHAMALTALLCLAGIAHADSTLTIFPIDSGTFSLRGDLLDKISNLDVSVIYDAGTLTNPRVSCGALASQASCSADTSTSGMVRLQIGGGRPVSGWGQLATFNFNLQAEDAGIIQSMDARATDVNGDAVAVETRVINPDPDQAPKRRLPRRDPQLEAARPATSTISAGGGVTQGSSEPAQVIVLDGSAKKTEVVKEPPLRKVESVLDRFRAGSAMTPDQRMALFRKNVENLQQEPAVVLSDGRSTVRLIVQIAADQKNPRFVLSGVSYRALRQDGGQWSIEVLPAAGVYQATMKVLTDKAAIEYPLTVAPPLAMLADGTINAGTAHSGCSGSGEAMPAYLLEYIRYANLLAEKPDSVAGR